jgi:beta,beta-carotene 9',10'-dioxygenase
MTETPLPVQFDPDTLAAAGVVSGIPGQLTTAHPHRERDTGAMLNFAVQLGPRSEYRFFRLAPDPNATPATIACSPVREPGYTHSFGLTARWLVLAELPLCVVPLRLALGGRPYIENYRWRPERGLRFHLYDRTTGAHSGPFVTEPRFAFHHVNAHEDGDEVVVDLCTFPDAGIVEDLYLQRLRDGRPVTRPTLERFRLTPAAGAVAVERLADEGLDLPRINYARANERPYRYVWGAGVGSDWFDRVVKVDVQTGDSATWREDGCFPGEPVFVGRPGAEDEDDGVLLSVVLGPDGRSFLLVLDAASLAELARAAAPHHIPFGFHGAFSARE